MKTLSELFDIVVMESGMFLVADSVEIGKDSENFRKLTEFVLQEYSQYIPKTGSLQIITYGRFFDIYESPRRVYDVIPLETFQSTNYIFQQALYGGSPGNGRSKTPFVWRYEKPRLYIPYSGKFEVKYYDDHIIELDETDLENPFYYISSELKPVFTKLLTARFMISIGRNRRAFSMDEIPVKMDSTELVSEGKEMLEKAMEELQNNAKFGLAWS